MSDFPIDPPVRVRAQPELVLRRTDEAVLFLRKALLQDPGGGWPEVLRSFNAIHDEVSTLEAVVDLELLLESKGLLIEDKAPFSAAVAAA